ncbi:MAG: amidohydrolase 2 [Candidatus Magnetoglobus multicellularis str. Araruama]|uniref:Amidohydrolase 2 n=1 Tax=Candidatus Magnetoglobus multicellularis str. Araruama TaxID=890399 RepID=A0A1V1PA45_9BACT|nr:MAG: amidohydrolase 2 [Candidatus Magnetoglobus multicellularis str. Araruama]
MIIDCHTHIFPKAVQENRGNFFDGEPGFQLLYENEKSKIVGLEQLIQAMDDDRIDRSVVFGFPWKHEDYFKQNNDYILEAVTRYPDRLMGFCCLDPYHPDSEKEVERCLKAGLSGVGELGFYTADLGDETIKHMLPIMELAHIHNKPVMIHTNEPVGHLYPGKTSLSVGQIYHFVECFPNNTIILAHWGGGVFFYHLLKKEAKDILANVYVDSAASIFLYDQRIWSTACDILGSEKILFGSDYPLLPGNRYFSQIDANERLQASDKENILGKSALKLFSNI